MAGAQRLKFAAALFCAAAACASAHAATLQPFGSEQEIADVFAEWAAENKRRAEEQRRKDAQARREYEEQNPGKKWRIPIRHGPKPASDGMQAERFAELRQSPIDHPGIAKLHGEHLLVLQRGRLFSVRIGGGQLALVSALDTFAELEPTFTHHDEMLVWRDTVLVIRPRHSISERTVTDLSFFSIDAGGALTYRTTYQLRSNYHTGGNYAVRLDGSRLIFYSPNLVQLRELSANRPALRRVSASGFELIAPATRIYRSPHRVDAAWPKAFHTSAVCDLAAVEFACRATAVLTSHHRAFHVSRDSVFIWFSVWNPDRRAAEQTLVRMPHDGSAPTALKVSGFPAGQFAWHQGDDGYLNVLVNNPRPDALAVLRVPLSRLGDGTESASEQYYGALPKPAQSYSINARFVGRYLLYGDWGLVPKSAKVVYAVRYADGGPAHELSLDHAALSLEALGGDALVGAFDSAAGAYDLTTLTLSETARIAARRRLVLELGAGVRRSYYAARSGADGILALELRQRDVKATTRTQPVAVAYLRYRERELEELGTVRVRPESLGKDEVGPITYSDLNARPIFLGDRILTLLGYDLVESRLADRKLVETRRIHLSPTP